MGSRREPLWRRYLRFFGPDAGADVDDEIRFHLDMRERDYLARGLSPEEARLAARARFGDAARLRHALTRQDARRLRRARWAERASGWTQDLRYAVRTLRHHRGFTIAVIATLALGIGANATIFSAVDAAMLRPLPFASPRRLVELRDIDVPFAPDGRQEAPSPVLNIREVGVMRDLFSDVGAYASGGLNLGGAGEPLRVRAGVVTPSLFPTLGVQVALGRGFYLEEGRPGNAAVTVVSHGLWQRQLGGGEVLGKTVRLNGRPYRIVGVMPRGFTFPETSDLWIPLTVPTTWEAYEPFRGAIFQTVVARLAPGVSRDMAAARLRLLWQRLPAEYRENYRETVADPVRSLQGSLVGDRRTPMLILLGATVLLLLIACVNVTNLLLAHGATRARELAVRAVLGATRRRLLRQLLVQSLVLSTAGALAGLVLARTSLGAVGALMPKEMRGLAGPELDPRLLAFLTGLAVLTALAFGLWPSLAAARADHHLAMKSGGGHGSTGGGRGRVRRVLVTVELALALMLVTGAGLMLKSFRQLLDTDSGFRTDHVGTLQLVLDGVSRPHSAERLEAIGAMLERMRGIPGIEAVGAVNDLPLSGQSRISNAVTPEGAASPSGFARWLMASAGYFQALGIPLLRGRLMTEMDDSAAPRIAVINETMARRLWPGRDPLGKRFRSPPGESRTVVGVVKDVRERPDAEAEPQAYYPIHENGPSIVSLVARGSLPAPELLAAMQRAIRAADPTQAVFNVRTLDEMYGLSLAPRRSNTALISAFGGLALLLAVIGVYGVAAYTVALRTRELGIRAALGASRRRLAGLVVREGLGVALLGVTIGLAGALAFARVLRGLLYGVAPSDAGVLVASAAALLVAVLGAALIPARRASRADPVEVMRAE
jgi:predicted permease